MKKITIFVFFIIFLFLIIPASEARKVYAPDLKVSRFTLNSGSFTIQNVGSKNSPAAGFDVLLYYQKYGGSIYKKVYHCSRSIAPGYSRNFQGGFNGANNIKCGLIRVNPQKKFLESDYSNNIRYFSMINVKIPSYTATEQARYYGGDYWQYWNGYTFTNGNSTTCSNGDYSPLISTNPIATGYNYYLGYWSRKHHWEWRNDPLYVNAVDIYYPFAGGKRYMTNYVAVSGIRNTGNVRVYADFGYGKYLTYNAAKKLWEGFADHNCAQLRYGVNIKIHSIHDKQAGTDDVLAAVSNVKIYFSYIKNSWSWLY